MIGKMTLGSWPIGILNYCYYEKQNLNALNLDKMTLADVRGEIIYAQNVALDMLADGRFDMQYLASQFENYAAKNNTLKNYVWHQSFSFPKGENITNQMIEKISQQFSKDFGFEENALISFKHCDTNHQHFHIVGCRINTVGKTTAKDSKSYVRTGTFCREMEAKLGLKITNDMKANRPKGEKINFEPKNKIIDEIKEKIDKNLPNCSTIEELKKALDKDGVKTFIGRGIAFLDKKTKSKFKGSQLGRNYSLENLKKRLGKVESPKKEAKTFAPKITLTIDKTSVLIANELINNIEIYSPKGNDENYIKGRKAYLEDEDEKLKKKKRKIRR